MIALKVGPDLSMAIVAAPGYLERHPQIVQPADLIQHRCMNYRLVTAGTIYAWEFEKDGKTLEVGVTGPLTFNKSELMLGAAIDGLGVGYLLEHEVAPYLASGQLTQVLADWTPPFPGFHFYYPSRRQMRPVLAAFLDLVRGRNQQGLGMHGPIWAGAGLLNQLKPSTPAHVLKLLKRQSFVA
ncbi:LysR substrate-binding domain-containing protein [Rhizobium sullae]|uniref:LysR substrate-binding domain-containing protein n=1 Tax=Rhizobium sullae TaxID=50338 RepID=UPI001FCE2A7E|nr:LysR substrate-binding domain-containing protein [Rhizobium sullae]